MADMLLLIKILTNDNVTRAGGSERIELVVDTMLGREERTVLGAGRSERGEPWTVPKEPKAQELLCVESSERWRYQRPNASTVPYLQVPYMSHRGTGAYRYRVTVWCSTAP